MHLTLRLTIVDVQTPLLAQQRRDFERTQQEADQLATQLATVLSERDTIQRHAMSLENQFQSEKLLVRQLELSASDLGRQVQHLLRRIAVIEDPTLEEVPTLPAASDDILSADLALSSDSVILFENLASLQQQNQLLLRVAHGSALALDRKEREFRETLEKEEAGAIREANEAIATLEEQLETQSKTYQLKLQACQKELDLYKSKSSRMVANLSYDGTLNEELCTRREPSAGEADLRNYMEAYRMESEKDSMKLRDDISKLQLEVNRTSAELAKANGTIQYLNGTYHESWKNQRASCYDKNVIVCNSKRNR
jgi:nucleoprotein TPR